MYFIINFLIIIVIRLYIAYKDIEINESAQFDKPISTPLAMPGTIIE